MTLSEWISASNTRFREHSPRRAVEISAQEFWLGILRRAGRRIDWGTPVYEWEWDVLVVLDACRWDALQELATTGRYEYLPDSVSKTISLGSMSSEWMAKNFTPKYRREMARTAHITWNPWSDQELNEDDWALLDEVWRYEWNDIISGVPPEVVTDRAIKTWRSEKADRMIVHYMQPHVPYRSLDVEPWTSDILGELNDGRETVWDWLREGRITRQEVVDAYRDNLHWALDSVSVLLENLDAERVVLTADHGESFGEWGVYDHPKDLFLPQLKRVPWVEVPASDERTHAPRTNSEETTGNERDDNTVTERLRALGYLGTDANT